MFHGGNHSRYARTAFLPIDAISHHVRFPCLHEATIHGRGNLLGLLTHKSKTRTPQQSHRDVLEGRLLPSDVIYQSHR